jgi:hypothetical protein
MRAVLVPVLLALLVAACTTDELARSAYNGAKDTCRLHPGWCSVNPEAR